MVSTALLYFLILHGANTLKSQDSDFNTEHGHHLADFKTSHLQRRSPSRNVQLAIEMGSDALEKLLRQTKLLYTNGYDEVLVKGGGYKQALSDFKSIDPDVIKKKHAEILGTKGNLVLKLSLDGDFPKMSLEMKALYPNHFDDKPPLYTIFYKPTLAMSKDNGLP